MQDKLKFPFTLEIVYSDKPTVKALKTFNCKKVSYAWGAAKRWAVKESEKQGSLEWELSIGH